MPTFIFSPSDSRDVPAEFVQIINMRRAFVRLHSLGQTEITAFSVNVRIYVAWTIVQCPHRGTARGTGTPNPGWLVEAKRNQCLSGDPDWQSICCSSRGLGT